MAPALEACLVLHVLTDILLIITLVVVSGYGKLAATRLHRNRDPARRVFSWVKLTWILLIISVTADFAEVTIVFVTSRLYIDWKTALQQIGESNDSRFRLLAVLMLGSSVLAHLFNVLTEILICLSIFSFIRCIRLALPYDEKHPPGHKWPRIACFAASFLLALIALVVFSISIYRVAMSGLAPFLSPTAWSVYSDSPAVPYLDLICQSSLITISSCLLIRSVLLYRNLRAIKSIHKPLKYLVLCCCLSTIRTAYGLFGTIYIYFGPTRDPHNTTFSAEELLSVIFVTWPAFIILLFLYFIGTDKKTPLCSASRPLLDSQSQAISSDSLTAARSDITPMTDRPLLDSRSQIVSSDSSAVSHSGVVPLSERSSNLTIVPASEGPESLFECDGLTDAPPEYSPPAQHPATASMPGALDATLPMNAPIIMAVTLPTTQPEALVQAEALSQHSAYLSETTIGLARSTTTTTQDVIEPSQLSEEPSQPLPLENNSQVSIQGGSEALSIDDQEMGLYHQADGRSPDSLNVVPLHDEGMGLYHQADGRPPGITNVVLSDDSNTSLFAQFGGVTEPNNLPSHDEAMGLYHQADGREPKSDGISCPEKKRKN